MKHRWRLVLLGAPGVGKGTQAELLSERLGACHPTGDAFRRSLCGCASINEAQPLIQFYGDLGLLVSVNAKGSPEEILQRTMTQLEAPSLAS